MSLDKAIRGAMEPLKRALWRTIRRGIVRLSDATAMLQVEGYEGERTSDVEYWQHYGFWSRPPAGTEALVLQVGGGSEQPIAIATHNDFAAAAAGEGSASAPGRPDSIEGEEAVLYSRLASVHVTADGHVNLQPASLDVTKMVNVGGDAAFCTERLMLGSTYNAAHRTMLLSLQGAMTSLGQSAAASAIGTFLTAQNSWLSARSRTR